MATFRPYRREIFEIVEKHIVPDLAGVVSGVESSHGLQRANRIGSGGMDFGGFGNIGPDRTVRLEMDNVSCV